MTAPSWKLRIKTDRVHRTGFCQRGHWLDDTQDKYGRCRRCQAEKIAEKRRVLSVKASTP